jgi:hypothetical protein
LVQQRLGQRLQRGQLPLVEAGEALGFRSVHEAVLLLAFGWNGNTPNPNINRNDLARC